MEDNWHICTEGLEKDVIFKTKEDYIVGMNGIPVSIVPNNLTLLAFCLMNNHVHFIVRGTEDNCRRFITQYKRVLGCLANLSRTDTLIKRICDTDYLTKAIGYVLRNPLSAGIRIMPLYYKWSSASLYFRGIDQAMPSESSVRKISELSYRDKRRILHSNTQLLDGYAITEDGMISPECYVDIKTVENLFRSPARLLYAISRNENMEMELSGNILQKTKYSDDELLGTVNDICRENYHKSSVESLSIEQRFHLAKILRQRYGINRKQISRLTLTDPLLLKKML